MKRGISFFLVCSFLFTFTAMTFSGCAGSKNTMQVSEWLYLINQKFGFSQSIAEEPYNSAITQDNPYYSDVQLAYEYSVLPSEYTELDLDKAVTREFCAVTLAGAVYIPNLSELNINDSDKLTYPEQVTTVINDGIMSLDKNGKFSPSKKVPYDDAVEALDKAYQAWLNQEFETKMSYTLSDKAVDFMGLSTIDQSGADNYAVSDDYVNEQKKWLQDNHFSYDDADGTVELDSIADKNITEESIILLPADIDHPAGLYLKVEKIKQTDEKYILSTSEAELDEVFPDGFSSQGTEMLDLTRAVVHDEDGNVLYSGMFDENYDKPVASAMSNVIGTALTGSNDGFSVPIKVNGKTGEKVVLKIGIQDSGFSAALEYTDGKKTLGLQKGFEKLKLVHNVDLNLLKYQKVGISFDETDTLTLKHSFVKYNSLGEDYAYKQDEDSPANNFDEGGNEQAFEDAIKMLYSDTSEDNSFTGISKAFGWDIPTGVPGLSAKLAFVLRINIDGSVEFSFSQKNKQLYLEKREATWKLFVPINPLPNICFECGDTTKSLKGAVKAEITGGLNIAVCLIGKSIADLEPALGIGASISMSANIVNQLRQPLEVSMPVNIGRWEEFMAIYAGSNVLAPIASEVLDDTAIEKAMLFCGELKVYPIVKLTALTSDSLMGKIFGSLSHEFLGSKSTPLICGHAEIDSGGFQLLSKCTLSDRANDGIERGDHIEIAPSEDIVIDEVGKSVDLKVTMLPETKKKIYTLEDLVVKVEDPNGNEDKGASAVITVKTKFNKPVFSAVNLLKEILNKEDTDESDIKITAINSGDCVLKVSTKDGLFKAEPINIHVNTPTESSSPSVDLKTYSAAVAVGGSIKLTVTSIAGGKDENFVFWECDDESVAHVDPITGKITGIAEGSCVVKAYVPGYEDNAVGCLITVTKDHTSTNVEFNGSGTSKQWIKIEGQPVIILERA